MKNSGMIVSVISLLMILNAHCSINSEALLDNLKSVNGKWVDNHSYRISAKGSCSGNINNVTTKNVAIQHAIYNAQNGIIDDFKKMVIHKSTIIHRYDSGRGSVARELISIARSGTVTQISWVSEKQCEIIYEIYALNLKYKVQIAEW